MNRRAKKAKASLRKRVVLEPNLPASQSSVLNQSVGALHTLYFHTGTHKTGSTALQVYLATNKELMGAAGISYEFPTGTDQSMGNGQYFYDQIHERNMPESQLDELLEFYIAGRTTAICSSENFALFKFKEWRQI